jgi:hypothetical protein
MEQEFAGDAIGREIMVVKVSTDDGSKIRVKKLGIPVVL